jgi:hypothetical protein
MINATVIAATSPTSSDEYDPRYPPTNHPPTTINVDLANERASLSFTPLHITNFIDGVDVGGLCLSARRWMYEEEYYRNITCTSLLIVPDAG